MFQCLLKLNLMTRPIQHYQMSRDITDPFGFKRKASQLERLILDTIPTLPGPSSPSAHNIESIGA